MGAVLVGVIVVAMVALPLVLAVRSDRGREAGGPGGGADVTLDVTAPSLAQKGRVVLTAPEGYDWMVERAWTAVASEVPAGYDLVVSRPDVAPLPSPPPAS